MPAGWGFVVKPTARNDAGSHLVSFDLLKVIISAEGDILITRDAVRMDSERLTPDFRRI